MYFVLHLNGNKKSTSSFSNWEEYLKGSVDVFSVEDEIYFGLRIFNQLKKILNITRNIAE